MKPMGYKKQYGVTVNEDIWNHFASYCKEMGLVQSQQIELMIKSWLIERGVELDDKKTDS